MWESARREGPCTREKRAVRGAEQTCRESLVLRGVCGRGSGARVRLEWVENRWFEELFEGLCVRGSKACAILLRNGQACRDDTKGKSPFSFPLVCVCVCESNLVGEVSNLVGK